MNGECFGGSRGPSEVTQQENTLETLLELTLRLRKEVSSLYAAPVVSPKVGLEPFSSGQLIATETIPAGTLIFSEGPKMTYPNFIIRCLEDNVYKVVDVRRGVVPRNWSCSCCTDPVGGIIPVWCARCDLPLCSKCGVKGVHRMLDPMCDYGKQVGVRGRRHLDLGDVYIDVALTRFIQLEKGSEEFRHDVARMLMDNTRIRQIATSIEAGPVGHKLNQKSLPLSFTAAKGDKHSMLMAYTLLATFGTGFYPNADVGFFHPVFSMLTQNCYPNVEVELNQEQRKIMLWTTQKICTGERLGLDFLQHPMLPTVYRQRFHQSKWGVGCTCGRCCDPSEFGTYLGSLKCSKCVGGYLSPQFIRFTHEGIQMWDEKDVSCFCMDLTNPDHSCCHMVPLSFLTEHDALIRGMISKMSRNQVTRGAHVEADRYKESQRLKSQLISEFGYHANHFLLALFDEHLSSPQLEFVGLIKEDSELEELVRETSGGLAGLQEGLSNFQHFFSIVLHVTPQLSRHNGYMFLYEALLEKVFGEMRREEEVGRFTDFEVEWRLHYIFKLTPMLIRAWQRLFWRKSVDDLPALSRLATEFMASKRDPGISVLKGRFMHQEARGRACSEPTLPQNINRIALWDETVPAEPPSSPGYNLFPHDRDERSWSFKIIPDPSYPDVAENASVGQVEENWEGSDGGGAEDSSIPPSSRRGAAAELLLQSVKAAAAMDNSENEPESSNDQSRVYAHPVKSPRVKPNKLKEALLRKEKKKRALRVKGVKKLSLRPADPPVDSVRSGIEPETESGMPESDSQGTNSAETPLAEPATESEQSEGGDGGVLRETESHLMVNPIPVHASPFKFHSYHYNLGGRRWNAFCHVPPIGSKKRYRHNGVDFPYVGTLNANMIVNHLCSPKSHKVIDCATYGNPIPNSDAAAGGVTVTNPGQENNCTVGAKKEGRTPSVLKYLSGTPPSTLFNHRKKCGHVLCEQQPHSSNFGGGAPTFFQHLMSPGPIFASNFTGFPQPMFIQPLPTYRDLNHNETDI